MDVEVNERMARFNFGPCPDGEIESDVFGTVYSTGDCGVILRYSGGKEVLYGCCWMCLTTTARAWPCSLASFGV
jgi:hypothetical protein